VHHLNDRARLVSLPKQEALGFCCGCCTQTTLSAQEA
jgi:hypothetical protein